jgi:hypothetical protein
MNYAQRLKTGWVIVGDSDVHETEAVESALSGYGVKPTYFGAYSYDNYGLMDFHQAQGLTKLPQVYHRGVRIGETREHVENYLRAVDELYEKRWQLQYIASL